MGPVSDNQWGDSLPENGGQFSWRRKIRLLKADLSKSRELI